MLSESDPAREHHFLVAIEGGEVLGYAKSGTHRSRSARSSAVPGT
jgi:hypothetical protein